MPKSRPETKHTSEPLPCKPGDVNGFDELVRQHQGWVRGYFRARINDWTAADDLAQEAFITAFQKLSSYKGEASFESWLKGIALNHFRNYIRKHREQYIGGSEELQVLIDGTTTEGKPSDILEALKECLSKTEGPARELLTERYIIGKTVKEIAAEQNLGYSAVTMKLHRMRLLLADCVNDTVGEWQT